MTDLFKAPELEETASQFADHMPIGEVWIAKNVEGTNMRSLITASAVPFNYVQSKVEELASEFNIDTTNLLLPEWEKSVGIPDCIATSTQTIEQRRDAVKRRLRKTPIVTIEEMQDYVDTIIPDSGVTLYNGTEYFSFEYTFESNFWGAINDKFVIVAEIPSSDPLFEYEFEIDFTGAANTAIIECVLGRVIPSNVYLLIVEV